MAQASLTPRPTLTPIITSTPAAAVAAPGGGQTPSARPTPGPGARDYAFSSDLRQSGWIGTGDANPHWGDRNVHAGTYQQQTFQSLLYFDMDALPPGSQVSYAEVDLTGLNRSNLGATGSWSLKLLPASLLSGWITHTAKDLTDAVPVAQIGTTLEPAALVEGQVNQFVFSSDQLALLRQAIDSSGQVAFRLDGPTGAGDSLFTWDGGDPDPQVGAHPTLRVIAVPARFVRITQTPTPLNVLTAAAAMVQGTQSAQLYGTPTPLPRQYATLLPRVVVTWPPPPANTATAQAESDYATAVALTTGTFTPTPDNWVTPTTTPPFLVLGQFTPIPTSTEFANSELSRYQELQTPIPTDTGLYGNIAFLTDREGAPTPQVWVMNPDGVVLGKVSGPQYYDIAETRSLYSPDKLFQVDVGLNDNGLWQVMVLDVAKGVLSPLITEAKTRKIGVGSYNPTWSPLGDKIAFVSDRAGTDEIFVYDVKTQEITRLTRTDPNKKTNQWGQNKHPSWSPDGKQIVFSSNRDPYPLWQLWIMNADGSGLRKLSPSTSDDTNPVWIR